MEVPKRRLAERAPDSTPHQGVGGELAVGSGPVHPWKPEYAKQDIEEFRKRC